MENKKYLIDGEEVSQEEFEERLSELIREYVECEYDNILDDCYGTFKVGYCDFYASEVLKQCDPVAYNCGLDDEIDYKSSDAIYEVEEYGTYEINGYVFEIEEVEEEEKEE